MQHFAALLCALISCQLALADTVIENTFDALGRKTHQTDPSGLTTQYEYDALGRLTAVIDAQQQRTEYGYDEAGNKTSQTDAKGHTTRWAYDSMGRVLTHTLPMNQTESFAYDTAGNVQTHTDFNGNTTALVYDINHRVTQKTFSDGATENYTYTATGQIETASNNAGTTSYVYDAQDRLVSETKPGGEQLAYGYDNNGNTLTENDAVNNTYKTYSYNAKNELIAANNGITHTAFVYDINGIRNKKTENNITTTYITDSNRDVAQVLLELENNSLVAMYTYGDDLISQQAANATSYYLYDGLGSTRALSNAAGQVTDTYEYAAFGENLATTGSTINNYQYTGEQFDETLNQYYLRARYYNQNTGRFTQRDTWEGNTRPSHAAQVSVCQCEPGELYRSNGALGHE